MDGLDGKSMGDPPSIGTLRPSKEESVDWGATQNLFIKNAKDRIGELKIIGSEYLDYDPDNEKND